MWYIIAHSATRKKGLLHYVFDCGEVARFFELYVRNMQIGAVSYCLGNL